MDHTNRKIDSEGNEIETSAHKYEAPRLDFHRRMEEINNYVQK